MGGACCKNAVVELNPDDTPKDPQTKEQKKEDPRDLRNAAKAADWTQMRLLLRRMPYAQINSGAESDEGDVDEKGNTALHFAVSINHLKGVRKLVRYGAEVGARNAAGQTPLHFALEAGKLKVSTFLFEKGANINTPDKAGRSPFLSIVSMGRKNLAEWAIANCKQDVDFDSKDCEGNTAVLIAAKYGWFDILEKWFNKIKMPQQVLNIQNKDGETVLGWTLKFVASELLDQEKGRTLVDKLLARGAVAVLPSFKEKVPPIHLAAATNSPQLFDAIKRAGGDPLQQADALGRSALHYAAAKGADVVCDTLLGLGLKPYQLDKQKNTPLHLAAMRGQEKTGKMMLAKADNQTVALLTANKDGLSVYHLALKAGNEEAAQKGALAMMELLGPQYSTCVMHSKTEIKETPLMLAIGSHQEQVVKKMIELGADVNLANYKGELPLARNLASVTPTTYDSDAAIFDMLMQAGSAVDSQSVDDHPMLAICKNSLSNFAERGVQVLSSKGALNWDKQDTRGYTPLMLAAYHDNAWLTKYLLDTVKVDPNSPTQRTKQGADMVVGSTGALCCKSPIIAKGTIGGQTALMCAAKGGSLGTLQILLSHGADVEAVDNEGRTALAYALTLDRVVTLECAQVLLAAGSKTKMPGKSEQEVEILDITGESWAHRAVRYGVPEFLRVWAGHGGSLDVLATTPEDADDMPGAEILKVETHDFIDTVPTLKEPEEEEPDEVLEGEEGGEDSEKDKEEAPRPAGAVAEGVEGSDTEAQVMALVQAGIVETFYEGPTPVEMLRWRKQKGARWWDEFWVDADKDLPPAELEDDLGWADQYDYCNVGEDELDEEDMMDFIRDQEERNLASILPRGGAMRAIRTARSMSAGASFTSQNGTAADGVQAVQSPSAGSGGEWMSEDTPQRSSPSLKESLSDLAKKVLGRGGSARLGSGGGDRPPLPAGRSPSLSAAGPVAEGVMSPSSPSARRSSMGAMAEVDGVFSPSEKLNGRTNGGSFGGHGHSRGASFGGSGAASAAGVPGALSMEEIVNAAAYKAALDLGMTPEMLASYGLAPPPACALPEAGQPSGPMAEGLEDMGKDLARASAKSFTDGAKTVVKVDANGRKVMEVQMSAADKAVGLVAGTPGAVLWANEPYFQPGTRYQGEPKYMSEKHNPWWPKVDFSDLLGRGGGDGDVYSAEVREKLAQDRSVKPSKWYLEDVDGPWNVESRLCQTAAKVEKDVQGPALRERNIRWYNKSLSPAEFPLKAGQWKRFLKKSKAACEAARHRAPTKPGEKVKIRKKKVWFGIPDLPSRPELDLTSPLVYAVRLGRASCVEVLAELSASVSTPDGHYNTPLQYALLLLYKDRHNKTVQRIVDLLLMQRPMVNTAMVAVTYLKPQAAKAAADHEAKMNEYMRVTGKEPPKSMVKRQVFLDDEKARWGTFRAQDEPNVMEPLILAVMLNDMSRLAWMVFKCGGNLNDAYVAMPDIPIYFQGLWEKMCGRCQCRVLPLHVGVMQKKFDTVRLMLDMGADPNAIGTEFTGKLEADMLRRSKLFIDKADNAFAAMNAAAGNNPYARIWSLPEPGLWDMLVNIKKFIFSIEIPGIARPQPWVSPLHLACRFGQAPITFLLLKRGAAPNGAGAAQCAKKSPLEEALSYARSNSQSYNALGECQNWRQFKRAAWLEEPLIPDLRAEMEDAISSQKSKLDDYMSQLHSKADRIAESAYQEALAAAKKAGKSGSEVKKLSPEQLVSKALADANFVPSTMADFSYDSLQKIPMPEMNLEAKAKEANAVVGAMFDAFMGNPTKIAIKVAAFAAKILIKMLQNMMKRPIAHWDPAIFAAHVMMTYRAPLHPEDKQTYICLKDMLDNQSYDWLKMNHKVIADPVWTQTAANKACALKTNFTMGYKNMDTTPEPKVYNKAVKKFESAVESAFFKQGIEAILPAYNITALVEHLTGEPFDNDIVHGGMHKLAGASRTLLNDYFVKQVNNYKEKIVNYCLMEETVKGPKRQNILLEARVKSFQREDQLALPLTSWGKGIVAKLKQATQGTEGAKGKAAWRVALAAERKTWATKVADIEPAFAEHAKKVAKATLPLWYVKECQAAGAPKLATAQDVVDVIVEAFTGYKAHEQRPKGVEGLPTVDDDGKSMNVLDHLLKDSDTSFKFTPPAFPSGKMATKKRKPQDLTFADAIKAMCTAYISVENDNMKKAQQQRITALTAIAKECQAAFLARMNSVKEKRTKLVAETAAALKDLVLPDEALVINAAMNHVNYEIAGKKLGPKGPRIMEVLEQALGPVDPKVTASLIEVAKALGKTGLQNGVGALLDQWCAKHYELSSQLTPEFRSVLNKLAAAELPTPFKTARPSRASMKPKQPVAESLENGRSSLNGSRRPSLAEQSALLSEFEEVADVGFNALKANGAAAVKQVGQSLTSQLSAERNRLSGQVGQALTSQLSAERNRLSGQASRLLGGTSASRLLGGGTSVTSDVGGGDQGGAEDDGAEVPPADEEEGGGEGDEDDAELGVSKLLAKVKQARKALGMKGGKVPGANALKQAQGAVTRLDKTLKSFGDGSAGGLLGLPGGKTPEEFQAQVTDLIDGGMEDLQAQADEILNEMMAGMELDASLDLEGLGAAMDDLQDAFDHIVELIESA